MARKQYTVEEIIGQLRTIEIELGKRLGVVEAAPYCAHRTTLIF
jgi:hypothetical protein